MQSRAKAPRYKGKEPCALAPWREVLIVCGLLTLAVVIVYGQTVRHDFVNFDDDVYVYENPHVQEGLSVASVTWAFTQAHVSAHWHPLTWLSLMADAQAVKLAHGRPDRALLAAEMHGVNAALHAVNSVLLFLVLRAMTASVWRERLRGGPLRRPPAARRVGCLGHRAKGHAERPVRSAGDPGVRCLRPQARCVPLRLGRPRIGAGPAGQTDAGHVAVCISAAGLLAAGEMGAGSSERGAGSRGERGKGSETALPPRLPFSRSPFLPFYRHYAPN